MHIAFVLFVGLSLESSRDEIFVLYLACPNCCLSLYRCLLYFVPDSRAVLIGFFFFPCFVVQRKEGSRYIQALSKQRKRCCAFIFLFLCEMLCGYTAERYRLPGCTDCCLGPLWGGRRVMSVYCSLESSNRVRFLLFYLLHRNTYSILYQVVQVLGFAYYIYIYTSYVCVCIRWGMKTGTSV